jgi:flagellar biosynthesis chaperone FliJ
MTGRTTFTYGLHALLRKRSVDLDLTREELVEASARVEAQVHALELSSARLAQLESEQRNLSRPGAPIDVDARMRLHVCLTEAVVKKQQHTAQLDQAKALQEQALESLRAARQELKAVEHHREQAAARFDTERRRKAQLDTDELYLLRLKEVT